MRGFLASFLAVLGVLAVSPARATELRSPQGWRLVWADEFSGPHIDQSCWRAFTERPHNNPDELQRFVDSPYNVQAKDGLLRIRAQKVTTKADGLTTNYTSTQLTTQDTASWTYARFESRIKVPKGKGLWPAFWMMPAHDRYGGWPYGGEVDIMEVIGSDPRANYAVMHYWDSVRDRHWSQSKRYALKQPLHDDFHVFALEWTPQKMTWFVDDVPYFTRSNWNGPKGAKPGAPFDQPFHLILNLSVGGSWGGPPDSQTKFPSELQVDYVRVYTKVNEQRQATRVQPIGLDPNAHMAHTGAKFCSGKEPAPAKRYIQAAR